MIILKFNLYMTDISDQKVKEWVDNIFKQLSEATSLKAIESLLNDPEILRQNKLSDVNYPAIKFHISVEKIQELKSLGWLNKDNTFSADLTSTALDPIAKLLYAIAWKNGDLQKVKHIVEGILDCEVEDKIEREEGVVFYQFGRYLSKTPGEPIIDQHVLRAFAIHRTKDLEEVKRLRKLSVISKKENKLIKAYKEWLKKVRTCRSICELQKDILFIWISFYLLLAKPSS